MYGVSKLKLGLYGANCSSGRAITLVPERWAGPSGAARRSTPGRQMFERGVNAALAFAAAAADLASCSVRVSGGGIGYLPLCRLVLRRCRVFRRVRGAWPLIPPDCRRETQWAV